MKSLFSQYCDVFWSIIQVTLDAFLFIPLVQADNLTAHATNKSLIYIFPPSRNEYPPPPPLIKGNQ